MDGFPLTRLMYQFNWKWNWETNIFATQTHNSGRTWNENWIKKNLLWYTSHICEQRMDKSYRTRTRQNMDIMEKRIYPSKFSAFCCVCRVSRVRSYVGKWRRIERMALVFASSISFTVFFSRLFSFFFSLLLFTFLVTHACSPAFFVLSEFLDFLEHVYMNETNDEEIVSHISRILTI